MSTVIYLSDNDTRIKQILLDALHEHGYDPIESSPGALDRAGYIRADLAFVCSPCNTNTLFKVGDLTLDTDNICIMIGDGDRIPLTPIEFSMMSYLMKNKTRAVSRKELMETVWGVKDATASRVADDTAKRLRKKLKGATTTLETVWNYGFRLNPHL